MAHSKIRRRDDFDSRVTALCCRQWGISPAQFRRECEAGEILADDVYATVELAVLDSTVNFASSLLQGHMPLLSWLYPPTATDIQSAKQKRWNAEFDRLLRIAQPTSPETAKVLEQLRNGQK